MLADGNEPRSHFGELNADIHPPGESLTSLIAFISASLISWRDDAGRPAETGETRLTARLCSHLNSACHHSGWDHFQFKQEEPDEVHATRTIDLAVAPRRSVVRVEGRQYSKYQTVLPIECKRLPTPNTSERDEREYLFSRFSSTGGVDRFKLGHHGANHLRAAMIGYIQDRDVVFWQSQLEVWVDGLAASGTVGWSAADKLALFAHDRAVRCAHLRSGHTRSTPLDPIAIDHLWIEM